MVSCGSQASDAAGPYIELHANFGGGPQRTVDLLRGGGGDGQTGAGADRHADVETVAAGHAACGIDDNGFQRALVRYVREAHPQRAGFMDPFATAAAVAGRD